MGLYLGLPQASKDSLDEITQKVFFDIEIGGKPAGQWIIILLRPFQLHAEVSYITFVPALAMWLSRASVTDYCHFSIFIVIRDIDIKDNQHQ